MTKSNRFATRSANLSLRGPAFLGTAAVVIAVSVMASMIAFRFGGSAAADEASAKDAASAPTSLAGRWTGNYFGRGQGGDTLTFDIVACKEGWCGIAVKDDKSCGAVGVHLAPAPKEEGDSLFKGSLELVKGAAAYEVAAWRTEIKETGAVELHFVGDTGSELLLFRRSYPFEADLTRSGDAICTMDKATS